MRRIRGISPLAMRENHKAGTVPSLRDGNRTQSLVSLSEDDVQFDRGSNLPGVGFEGKSQANWARLGVATSMFVGTLLALAGGNLVSPGLAYGVTQAQGDSSARSLSEALSEAETSAFAVELALRQEGPRARHDNSHGTKAPALVQRSASHAKASSGTRNATAESPAAKRSPAVVKGAPATSSPVVAAGLKTAPAKGGKAVKAAPGGGKDGNTRATPKVVKPAKPANTATSEEVMGTGGDWEEEALA